MKKMLFSILGGIACFTLAAQQTEFPLLQNSNKIYTPFSQKIRNNFLVNQEKIDKSLALTIPVIVTDKLGNRKIYQLSNGNKIANITMEQAPQSTSITTAYESPYGEDGLYKYDRAMHAVLPKKGRYNSAYGEDGQYKYDKEIHAVPPKKLKPVVGR